MATRAAHLPPVSTLFAAFLGYNPIQHLVGTATLSHLTAAQQAALAGHAYFPMLISSAFRAGLHAAMDFAIIASLAAAWASWVRGKRYVHAESTAEADATDRPAATPAPVPVTASAMAEMPDPMDRGRTAGDRAPAPGAG